MGLQEAADNESGGASNEGAALSNLEVQMPRLVYVPLPTHKVRTHPHANGECKPKLLKIQLMNHTCAALQ